MKTVRSVLFLLTIATIAISIFSFVFFDTNFFIRKWNLPLDPPGFLDSRQFAWASEAYAQGYDPLVENPVNPRGHQLNYPRIWHLLFALGINEDHTNIIGSIVVALFFVGVGLFWFSQKFDNVTYIFLSAAILSPAVMLGVERSNIELILFFVISAAILVNYYSTASSMFIFLFASVLKLYPVFGFIYLLKENKKKFWTLFLSSLFLFVLYGLLSLADFKQVYSTTPKLVNSSFGLHVWWMGIRHGRVFGLPLTETLVTFFTVLSYGSALIILALTLLKGLSGEFRKYCIQGQYLDAFRVGSGIYIGCFLLMNTHDYRLIFLIFTIPQLLAWAKHDVRKAHVLPRVALTAMLLSLWSFFIMRFLGRKTTFVIEEFSNWVMFAVLLYLLFASLPGWFRDDLNRLLSINKRSESPS